MLLLSSPSPCYPLPVVNSGELDGATENQNSKIIFNKRLENKYRPDCKAPYVVHIEKAVEDVQGVKKNTSILRISNALRKIASKYVDLGYDLKRIGESKFKVSFESYKTANEFVNLLRAKQNDILQEERWLVYIPDYKVLKNMVMRGFEDGPEPDEVLLHLRPSPGWERIWKKPIFIEKLKTRRHNLDGSFSLIDSNTYVASYDTFNLPPSVVYNMRTIYLSPFVNKVQCCLHCLRYGHSTRFCKSDPDKSVCARCGSKGHIKSSCTSSEIKCVNCIREKKASVDHEATNSLCPIFIEQKSICYYGHNGCHSS